MTEKVYFENSHQQKLCGLLSDPSGDRTRLIVVCCHGFNSNKDRTTYRTLRGRLGERGIATFCFDFFGHGESEGAFEDITVSEAVDDVQRAILFLRQKGYMRIGLFGSSFGGWACLIAASQSEDIAAMALKSPVSDWVHKRGEAHTTEALDEWRTKGFKIRKSRDGTAHRLTYAFYEDAVSYSAYDRAHRITAPVLIVHGSRDESVPLAQSIKISKLIPYAKLEILTGADHAYSNTEDFERMISLVVSFLVDFS